MLLSLEPWPKDKEIKRCKDEIPNLTQKKEVDELISKVLIQNEGVNPKCILCILMRQTVFELSLIYAKLVLISFVNSFLRKV